MTEGRRLDGSLHGNTRSHEDTSTNPRGLSQGDFTCLDARGTRNGRGESLSRRGGVAGKKTVKPIGWGCFRDKGKMEGRVVQAGRGKYKGGQITGDEGRKLTPTWTGDRAKRKKGLWEKGPHGRESIAEGKGVKGIKKDSGSLYWEGRATATIGRKWAKRKGNKSWEGNGGSGVRGRVVE